jgi:hypothetical protein
MSPWSFWSLCITAVAVGVALALTWQLRKIGSQHASLVRLAARLQWAVWLWLAVALAASLVGFFQEPARFSTDDRAGFLLFSTLMSIPPIIFLLGVWHSDQLRQIVAAVPTSWLVGLQVYRLAGVIFLVLLAAGQVPPWWGWATGLTDLLVGATALPLAWGLARKAGWAGPAALGWNLLGLADFAHAIGYVFLAFLGLIVATPAPALIGLHPLALIALFQVPLAIMLHGVVLSRVIRLSQAERSRRVVGNERA